MFKIQIHLSFSLDSTLFTGVFAGVSLRTVSQLPGSQGASLLSPLFLLQLNSELPTSVWKAGSWKRTSLFFQKVSRMQHNDCSDTQKHSAYRYILDWTIPAWTGSHFWGCAATERYECVSWSGRSRAFWAVLGLFVHLPLESRRRFSRVNMGNDRTACIQSYRWSSDSNSPPCVPLGQANSLFFLA